MDFSLYFFNMPKTFPKRSKAPSNILQPYHIQHLCNEKLLFIHFQHRNGATIKFCMEKYAEDEYSL